jgi:transcriptional regulator with XRE-family HTH domain
MARAFADRFRLALDALSMSRGRFASELGVDKSLVGRWASGTSAPSAVNRERLTRLLAAKRPGFSLLDWDLPLPEFARIFGAPDRVPAGGPSVALQASLLNLAVASVDADKAPYEGFWRTTHASLFEEGSFCQQHGFIRIAPNGTLEFEAGADGIRYRGAMYPVAGQLFAIGSDDVRHLPSLMILNVMAVPKILFMDGLVLTASSPLRTPTAYPFICERIGDLSGDRAADDARAAELMNRPEAIEDSASLPEIVREHLRRDYGPTAARLGGDMNLTASSTPRLTQIIAWSRRAQEEQLSASPAPAP